MSDLDTLDVEAPDSGFEATFLGAPDSGTAPTPPDPDVPDFAALKGFLAQYGIFDRNNRVTHTGTLHSIGADLVGAGHVTPAELGVPHLEDSRDVRNRANPATVAHHVQQLLEKAGL